jgi:hypothetical protein
MGRESETYCDGYSWGDKKTLSKALKLEAADIVAGTPSRIRQTTARTFWRNQSIAQLNEETTISLPAGAVEVPTTLERTAPTNWMKKNTQRWLINGR